MGMEATTPSWIKKTVVTVVVVGLVLALAIQLVPVNRADPASVAEPSWDSPATRALLKQACFDCHSNETEWPWYSRIAPVSWLLAHDVQEGRSNLNFSEWEAGMGGAPLLVEVTRAVEGGQMPPAQYLLTHPGARLSDAEKQQLLAGLAATFK
jgi:mono/diheme cytochrome c family protein